MKRKLYIMVGIPASGKTTYLNKFRDKAIIVSRDEIRYSFLKEGDDYFSKEKEVFKEYTRQIQDALDNSDKDVYADATQVNAVSRFKLIKSLNLKNVDVYVICIDISLEKALERNKKRKNLYITPESTIKMLYNRLTFPKLTDPLFEEYTYKGVYIIHNEQDK